MFTPDYPKQPLPIKTVDNKHHILCAIRKKWIFLTPEEWVRQNFLQWLFVVMQYPQALIAVEKEILVNGLKKRFDILVYNKEHQPWMLVECKSHTIPLQENVFQQALRYNIATPVKYIVVTNGIYCKVVEKVGVELIELEALPKL
jgi:hypothetical protein